MLWTSFIHISKINEYYVYVRVGCVPTKFSMYKCTYYIISGRSIRLMATRVKGRDVGLQISKFPKSKQTMNWNELRMSNVCI